MDFWFQIGDEVIAERDLVVTDKILDQPIEAIIPKGTKLKVAKIFIDTTRTIQMIEYEVDIDNVELTRAVGMNYPSNRSIDTYLFRELVENARFCDGDFETPPARPLLQAHFDGQRLVITK